MTNATMDEMGSCGVSQGLKCAGALTKTVAKCIAARAAPTTCSVITCVGGILGSAGCCYPCVCYAVSSIMGSSCSSCSDKLYEDREVVFELTDFRTY